MTGEPAGTVDGPGAFGRLRSWLRGLYFGSNQRSALFQYGLLAFDVVTILFFLVVSFIHDAPWILVIDLLIAIPLTLDFAARIIISARPVRHLAHFVTIADLIVIVSLIIPALTGNFAFLRILRAIRLLRSYHVLGMLRRTSPWVQRNEEVVQSVINLLVFIFICTAIVYVSQQQRNPAIDNYVDALYFTITTLTTTGFGDITLVGDFGRLLAVLIMIFGISLFIRLVQTIFRPAKVRYECGKCGLLRHDPDAVHCKHCGRVLNIPNEGD